MKKLLLGAIAGDIIGSPYEFRANRTKDAQFKMFASGSRFTDDSVLTVAVADWLLSGKDLTNILKLYGNNYPYAGYGGQFKIWLRNENPKPYNSWGNGSAMRVSPVGWAFDTLNDTLRYAKESAEVTHNHPEGIKGAQATAACIYLARTGKSKQEIKAYIETTFGYDLNRTCDEIRPHYTFDSSCQGSVPESIIAFLESTDFENAVRLAVSLGGDADTMAAIAGGIAEAYYDEIPKHITNEVIKRLPAEFIDVLQRFTSKFILKEKKLEENSRRQRITPERIEELQPDEIFVFGSNLQGLHGGGAARIAYAKWGAVWGQGVGLQGKTYAIPTMQGGVETIKPYVDEFIRFAEDNPDKTFLVTEIGCGIAGFKPAEIAPLFKHAVNVENIHLPQRFWNEL